MDADTVACLAVVLAALPGADLSEGVAGARSRYPGVSRIDPEPRVVVHRRVGLAAAGQSQRTARIDHTGGLSKYRRVLRGIWEREEKRRGGGGHAEREG